MEKWNVEKVQLIYVYHNPLCLHVLKIIVRSIKKHHTVLQFLQKQSASTKRVNGTTSNDAYAIEDSSSIHFLHFSLLFWFSLSKRIEEQR
jgi:hypothetical protein